jgi:aspartyl-tRNA(Asn)/glutamyl-tRNA(Gln) amidotransferase subunit A
MRVAPPRSSDAPASLSASAADAWLSLDVPTLAALVARGDVSAEEIARASLERIEAENPSLGAFLTVQAEATLDAARALDRRRVRGERLGPLAGVPVGLKDALCTQGAPTTAGSRILTRDGASPSEGWRPPYDATVVARLRAADALLVGKCNMDELAMGSSTENSAFFAARNPWDRERTPGGSSGGSAVAVAARLVPASLGSDTGGSIRQPAALTGTVGLKPTYGRVSRYGLVAFASSLDQVGPIARDVAGVARLFDVIAGHDPRDATSLEAPLEPTGEACGREISGLRVGVPREYFGEGIEPAVEARVREAIAVLASLGATLVPVSLPHTKHAVAAYYVLATAEASSNLARLDGVRFGLRREPERGERGLAGLYGSTRGAGFGVEVKRRIVLGTYVLSAGYYEAYYGRAQRARARIAGELEAIFDAVDVLAAPVSPTVAFRLGERLDDPLAMYLADVLTLPASLAGLPALSVPTLPTPATAERPSLPVGLQLVGPRLSEARLVALAHAYESARGPIATPF